MNPWGALLSVRLKSADSGVQQYAFLRSAAAEKHPFMEIPIHHTTLCLQMIVRFDPSPNPHWRPHDEHRDNGPIYQEIRISLIEVDSIVSVFTIACHPTCLDTG